MNYAGYVFNQIRKVATLMLTIILPLYLLSKLSDGGFVIIRISIPLGILCAKYRDSSFDNILGFITYRFASIPEFILALLFLYFLCVKLGWFTVIAATGAKGIIMPALVLASTLSAWYIRQVRVIVLEELEKDYIVGVRARGVPERNIMFSHVLYNSLLPILTLVGISFAGLLEKPPASVCCCAIGRLVPEPLKSRRVANPLTVTKLNHVGAFLWRSKKRG